MASRTKKPKIEYLDTSKEKYADVPQEPIRQMVRIAGIASDTGPHAANNTTYWYTCPPDRIFTLLNVQQTTVTTGIQFCGFYVNSRDGFDKCVFIYDTAATALYTSSNRIVTPITLVSGDRLKVVYRSLTGDTIGWVFEGIEENDPLKNIK